MHVQSKEKNVCANILPQFTHPLLASNMRASIASLAPPPDCLTSEKNGMFDEIDDFTATPSRWNLREQ